MWPFFLLGLLLACLGGWFITARAQARRIRLLERSKEEIQVEETLVFDFLHGLGEAFRETIRPNDLHRLIVEGATRILDAHGGALYLADQIWLLLACLGGWFITARAQARRIRLLERSKEEIQVEETLVFDFLHGLGEAFRETIRPNDLHRLIVEGATRILDAHGGALYLAD